MKPKKVKLAADVRAAPMLAQEVSDYDESTASAAFVISTLSQDRDGDILLPGGCLTTLSNYVRNPIVLYDHGTQPGFVLPIALSEDPATKACTVTVEDERITARAFFHQQTLESSQIFALIVAKVLRGASVGFSASPGKMRPVDPKRPKAGTLFEEWQLAEWSVVPVPANQDALSMALSAKWDGKPLAAGIRKSFQSLIVPSTKTVFPVQSGSRKKKANEGKAMNDETQMEDQQQEEAQGDEPKQMPVGALCIKGLLDTCAGALADLDKNMGLNENTDAIKAIEKCKKKMSLALADLQTSAAEMYPDFFEKAEVAEEQPEEEVKDESLEEDEKPAEEEKAEDDEDKKDDEEASKSFRRQKSWAKECTAHVNSLQGASELLEEMTKSPNIPSGYKRQCKGVLPDLAKTQAWITGKSSGSVSAPPATEPDEQPSGEEVKALKDLQEMLKKNRQGLEVLNGAKR